LPDFGQGVKPSISGIMRFSSAPDRSQDGGQASQALRGHTRDSNFGPPGLRSREDNAKILRDIVFGSRIVRNSKHVVTPDAPSAHAMLFQRKRALTMCRTNSVACPPDAPGLTLPLMMIELGIAARRRCPHPATRRAPMYTDYRRDACSST